VFGHRADDLLTEYPRLTPGADQDRRARVPHRVDSSDSLVPPVDVERVVEPLAIVSADFEEDRQRRGRLNASTAV
jgi:hypothetical protein